MELERHAVGHRQPGPERVIQVSGVRMPDVHGRPVRAGRARLQLDLSGGEGTHAGWWPQQRRASMGAKRTRAFGQQLATECGKRRHGPCRQRCLAIGGDVLACGAFVRGIRVSAQVHHVARIKCMGVLSDCRASLAFMVVVSDLSAVFMLVVVVVVLDHRLVLVMFDRSVVIVRTGRCDVFALVRAGSGVHVAKVAGYSVTVHGEVVVGGRMDRRERIRNAVQRHQQCHQQR